MAKINIIGAGISGLSAAVHILKINPKVEINIYEASNCSGGRMKPFFIKKWNRRIINPHLISAANKNALDYLKLINIDNDLQFTKVEWKTTSYNPLSLYKLFVESVQNEPYEITDKNSSLILFLKSIMHGMAFYYATPSLFIKKSEDYIKKFNGCFFFNHKVSSISEFPQNTPLIVATDAFNLKHLGLLSGDIKSSPIINIHFNHPFKKQKIILCPEFSFPCVIFKDKNEISVTVSAANKLMKYKDENIAKIFWNYITEHDEICSDKINIPDYVIIKNKRATAKILQKNQCIENNNIIIATDCLNENLPSTIESSIISGFRAAKKALAFLS